LAKYNSGIWQNIFQPKEGFGKYIFQEFAKYISGIWLEYNSGIWPNIILGFGKIYFKNWQNIFRIYKGYIHIAPFLRSGVAQIYISNLLRIYFILLWIKIRISNLQKMYSYYSLPSVRRGSNIYFESAEDIFHISYCCGSNAYSESNDIHITVAQIYISNLQRIYFKGFVKNIFQDLAKMLFQDFAKYIPGFCKILFQDFGKIYFKIWLKYMHNLFLL
jgi:hypothetical protein